MTHLSHTGLSAQSLQHPCWGQTVRVRKLTELCLRCPRTWKPSVTTMGLSSITPLTNAGDAILGQHCPMVTEADDPVALWVHVALIYLAVAAVEVVLNIHFPMALHHWGQGGRVSFSLRLQRPPYTPIPSLCALYPAAQCGFAGPHSHVPLPLKPWCV